MTSLPSALQTPRAIGLALFVVASSTAGIVMLGHRPRRADLPQRVVSRSRSPMTPSGTPVYQLTLGFNRGRMYANQGVVRDSTISVRSIWRRSGENWVPLESTPDAIVLPPHQERPISDLIGADVASGLYAVALNINGRAECRLLSTPDRPLECGTGWVGSNAPSDPLPPADCRGEGFLAEMRPADGNGITTRFLEDGRIREQVPMRDGRADGVAIEYYREHDGAPTHFERTFVRGEMTLSRSFDPAGRQINELRYANGRPHGTFHTWNASGGVLEETVWNHGAVVSMHTLDGRGHIVSGVDYGMPGRDHGTYCRPNHHCSGW